MFLEDEVRILVFLRDNPLATTTMIAKAVYNPKDRQELVKSDSAVRRKLDVFLSLGVIEKVNEGKAHYSLVKERVLFGGGKCRFPVGEGRGKEQHYVWFDIANYIIVKTVGGEVYLKPLS
jgi:hypothetical protein